MIRVSIGYRGQSQDDPGHVRGNSVRIDRNKLNIGWDQLEASFEELPSFPERRKANDRRGVLSNMNSTISIDVYADPDIATFYVDEIQLIKKTD